jgi:hypothetical protein
MATQKASVQDSTQSFILFMPDDFRTFVACLHSPVHLNLVLDSLMLDICALVALGSLMSQSYIIVEIRYIYIWL